VSPRPTRTVRSALLKKGFIEKEFGNHRKLLLDTGGANANIRTYYSHGARECNDYILGQMAKHLCLTRAQLDALIDCQMSGDEYVEILRERGEVKV
jgi:DNA-binding MarR family transcriptional regulator